MGILNDLQRGEEGCSGPEQSNADLWIRIWEVLEDQGEQGLALGLQHVQARRTVLQEKKAMTEEQTFVVEGNGCR